MNWLPCDKMQADVTTAGHRQQQRQVRLDEQRACDLATDYQGSQILKAMFEASQVEMFGSVLAP